MIYVLEGNMLKNLSDADKKVLSAGGSDKILIFCDDKTNVPIDIMQFFMSTKAKVEFVSMYSSDSAFELGYQYGLLSAKHIKDKIIVLSDKDYEIAFPGNISFVKSLSDCKSNRVTRTRKPRTKTGNEINNEIKSEVKNEVKSETVTEVTEVKSEVIEVKSDDKSKTTADKPKRSVKSLSLDWLIKNYPALEPFSNKINAMYDLFIDALHKATDSEIGLKVQMQMVFGADGVDIWDIIKNDFDTLKKLA